MKLNNHNNVRIIGLTGGIATGKSTVSKLIKDKGFPLIDADKASRVVVEVGKRAYKDIVNRYGSKILNNDNTINRKMLGNIVFNNNDELQALNSIVHPRVKEEILDRVQKYKTLSNVIFIDIPLLIENKSQLNKDGIIFDEIWIVYAREEQQLERLMKRDNLSQTEAKARIKAQLSIEEKVKYASLIIDNTLDKDKLIKIVNNILNELIE